MQISGKQFVSQLLLKEDSDFKRRDRRRNEDIKYPRLYQVAGVWESLNEYTIKSV